MASSMWDTLLGGDAPYPLRVGDYCFDDKNGTLSAHKISDSIECCRQCRNQPDFHGVTAEKFSNELDRVDTARPGAITLISNPNGISPVVLKYFHEIPTADDATERVAHLIKYAGMFDYTEIAPKDKLEEAVNDTSSSPSSPVKGGAAGGAGGSLEGGDKKAVEDALKAYLEGAFAKVPGLATPSIMYEQALKRKGTWLAADGTVAYAKDNGTVTTVENDRHKASCNSQSERLDELQRKLIDELNKLSVEASKNEADGLCGLSCSEDTEMERMQHMYTKILAEAKNTGGGNGVSCDLNTFDEDDTIKLLQGKKVQLEAQSFAFLHAECEAVEQCDPHKLLNIPESLVDCSGLHESEILFNDTHMAAIGQYLAGAQRDGQSPGALGHASRLYKPGTIAPGVNPDELWINVCYRVPGVDDGDVKKIDTMWVRANVCDQRKYETLRAIRKAITEQKRAILALNREILDLQYQVSAGHGFAGPAAFFSTVRREGAADDGLRTQMAIKSSVARAANSMRRNSDRRRKPQLLEAEDGAYADDGFGGAEDPRFARMMRTLAVVVRGAR